jgi:hypothetical protein|nr:MAG TPA: hypothetical protein [Caudoviricetes sp.]
MIVYHAGNLQGLIRDIDELDHFISRMHLTRYNDEIPTAKLDVLRRAASTYKRYIINPLLLELGKKMNKPLHEIKDDEQLEFLIEAIDQIDYQLTIYQAKLSYFYDDVEDADKALMHLRSLIANFVRVGLGVIDYSESEDDE